jgi:hypothetical protein
MAEGPANDNKDFNDYLELAAKAHGAAYAKIAGEKLRNEELRARGVTPLVQKRK